MNIILPFIYALYLIIGIVLTIYWWKHKYHKEYQEAIKENAAKRGTEFEYIRYNAFPYNKEWPWNCEYPLTN